VEKRGSIMSKIQKVIIAIITLSLALVIFPKLSKAASDFDLENLNFSAVLDKNGNMQVTETWKIDINGETNTLFKTFELDSSKYSSISNVTVAEIATNGTKTEFKQINSLMYHVTTDCYYAMKNSDGDFEIAWGINKSSGRKTYEISYTVKDAVTVYSDCAELYWQFIGENFAAPADKVTGTIKLPAKVEMLDNLRVWGHRPVKWGNYKNCK